MKNIIIFDLDYTLTKKGTWGRFVLYTVKYKPWIWLPLILSAGFAQWRYKAGYTPRISVKQSMKLGDQDRPRYRHSHARVASRAQL